MKMRRTDLILLLAVIGFSATPGAHVASPSLVPSSGRQGPPAGPVEKQVMSPAQAEMEFFVSPTGGHFAAIVPRGSRFAVFADGAEEPRFDEILEDGTNHKIHFSPDNARHAYMARLGDEYVAMVDGKEILRLPVAGTRPLPIGTRLTPTFTPNGKHTYFAAHVAAKPGAQEGDRLWWDGVPVPSPLPFAQGLIVSPDGDHFALAVAGAPHREALVVDGKLWTLPAGSPTFTADGRHLITEAAAGPGVRQLLVDGKPWVSGNGLQVVVPPGPGLPAAVVSEVGSPSRQYVVVGTERVAASIAPQVQHVYFSPDGKHVAITCVTETGRHFVVLDGKKGLDYEFLLTVSDLNEVVFSSDSAHSMYYVKSGKKEFVVVDGVESDGYSAIYGPAFSGDGKRFGFVASNGGVSNGPGGATMERWVVVDGKPVRADGQVLQALGFSARGGHYAYIAGSNANPLLVLDGVPDAKNKCCESLLNSLGPRYVFSEDGAHIAHFTSSSTDPVLVVDGKAVRLSPGQVWKLSFTPDGRHLLWLQYGGRNGFTVYADGKAVAQFEANETNLRLLGKQPGAWDMTAGVLTVFGQAGDTMQRVRVRPPTDTSIDTLLAGKR
jgi:hypothetical protein